MQKQIWYNDFQWEKNDAYYTSNFSISCWSACIWGFNCEPSFVVMEHAITGLETPQARPRAVKGKKYIYFIH